MGAARQRDQRRNDEQPDGLDDKCGKSLQARRKPQGAEGSREEVARIMGKSGRAWGSHGESSGAATCSRTAAIWDKEEAMDCQGPAIVSGAQRCTPMACRQPPR